MNQEDESDHIPVLLRETIEGLSVGPGKRFIDATLGGGGHAQAILEASAPDGRLLGLDADPEAIVRCRQRLAPYQQRVVLVHANFANLEAVAQANGFTQVDGVLLDLGLSSFQLAAPERGFSFQLDGPLDMRFDPGSGPTIGFRKLSWQTFSGAMARSVVLDVSLMRSSVVGPYVPRPSWRPR